ncbi:MAG: hypothetical protein LBP59_01525 [Planctomycetaceae bacterium]|jgi:hypothetical protein|nr:hypothetical protein [Planctomycetaceae bacterium]
MSTNYATTSVVKSSSANSATQTTNQTETTTQPAKDYPYVDVVTFSQEALEASEKLSVENAEPRILDDLFAPKEEEKKYWYDLLERNNSKNNTAKNDKNTLYSDKYKPAEIKPIKFKQGVDTLFASKIYAEKWKDTITQIDEKITEILNENDIALTKDETLNFSINQDGKISIGKGISEYKKTILEKIFNEDNELRAGLFHSHYSLPCSKPLWDSESDSYFIGYDPSTSLTFENLLRNYGYTINDFELTSEEEKLAGALPIKFKDGTNNDEFLLTMFTDDADTFDYIENHLVYKQNTGSTPREYELNFSYKNGITIEKERGDQNSLDERFQFILDDKDIPIFHRGEDTSNIAITINPSGEIVDAEIIDQNLNPRVSEKEKYNVTKENFDLFTLKLKSRTTGMNNKPEYQPWFEQYVFEAQRLAKYKSGEDTSKMNLVINRTFLNKEITNGRRS